MTKQAVSRRLIENPELKKKILSARENAMKRACITRSRVYTKVAEGLDAVVVKSLAVDGEFSDNGKQVYVEQAVTDFKERRESAKMCLQLFQDLGQDAMDLPKPAPIEPHLHLHFENLNSADLTNLLLGRFNGPSVDPQKPR